MRSDQGPALRMHTLISHFPVTSCRRLNLRFLSCVFGILNTIFKFCIAQVGLQVFISRSLPEDIKMHLEQLGYVSNFSVNVSMIM